MESVIDTVSLFVIFKRGATTVQLFHQMPPLSPCFVICNLCHQIHFLVLEHIIRHSVSVVFHFCRFWPLEPEVRSCDAKTEVSRGVTFKGAAVEKWFISRLTLDMLFLSLHLKITTERNSWRSNVESKVWSREGKATDCSMEVSPGGLKFKDSLFNVNAVNMFDPLSVLLSLLLHNIQPRSKKSYPS